MDWLQAQDEKLLLFLNGTNTTFGDVIMQIASSKLVWIPAYLCLGIFLFRIHGFRYFLLTLAVLSLVILASDQIASGILKPLIARPRPCHVPSLHVYLHLIEGKCGGAFGFVSSHAANFFALAIFLSWHLGKKIRWLPVVLFGVAGFVSFSRIYLGVHYPGDVVGGILVGLGAGSGGIFFFKFLARQFKFSRLNEKRVVDIK